MKRKLILCFILSMCFLVGCGGNDDEKDKGKNTETQQESEVDTEAEKVANMTEEYKAYCELIYEDKLYGRDRALEGKHVKIYAFIRGKGSYSYSSMFASAIRDLTKKYELSNRYISIEPAYEKRGDMIGDLRYNGSEQMYLLFEEGKDSAIDEYKNYERITIYGEIVQCAHGPFVLVKYVEYTEESILIQYDSTQQ
ncbi:MAG: hypothetical protein IJ455_06575 [Agathobacter sp.]|nr:hypothetical protein [Agathobacter sp.]